MTTSVTDARAASPRTRFAKIAIVALIALTAAACGANQQPTGYGEDYRNNFMLGCTGVDPDTGESPEGYEPLASEKQCVCVYDGLVEKVPFEEAKDFEESQAEAETGADIEIPDNIAAIFDDCKTS